MKKKIQKYLSGSNEGFSLVELIIVIAIMAILVGVVALAVIPNLERSRESKDLSTLDSACSALAAAVANAGSGASAGSFELSTITAADSSDLVKDEMFNQLGDCSKMKMVSAAGKKASKIVCSYDASKNEVKVEAVGADPCKYQKDDNGSARTLSVSNGNSSSSSSSNNSGN